MWSGCETLRLKGPERQESPKSLPIASLSGTGAETLRRMRDGATSRFSGAVASGERFGDHQVKHQP